MNLKDFILAEIGTHSRQMKEAHNISDATYISIVTGILETVIDELGAGKVSISVADRKEAFDKLEEILKRVCLGGGSLEKAIRFKGEYIS